MNIFYGRGLLAILALITEASGANPITPPGEEIHLMPALLPDTRCDLSISNPVVDYGTMSRWQLKEVNDGNLSPGTRSLMLNVVCPYRRVMKLHVEGESNEQGKLRYGVRGTTRLQLLDAKLDGNAVVLRAVTPAGTIVEGRDQTQALPPGQRLVSVAQGLVVEGRILTARIEVQPVLPEKDTHVGNYQRSETLLTLTLNK